MPLKVAFIAPFFDQNKGLVQGSVFLDLHVALRLIESDQEIVDDEVSFDLVLNPAPTLLDDLPFLQREALDLGVH